MRWLASLQVWLFLCGGLAGPVVAENPPASLVASLVSDDFPEREKAEGELLKWVRSGGERRTDWLLRRLSEDEDPEVRERSLRVLREVVLEQLESKRPGFLGISMVAIELTDAAGGGYGIEVGQTTDGSPAERAGLKPGDVIVSLNGQKWASDQAPLRFAEVVGGKGAGDRIALEVLRAPDGGRERVEIILAARPWAAGLYSDGPGGRAFANEKEAREAAFASWLRDRGRKERLQRER